VASSEERGEEKERKTGEERKGEMKETGTGPPPSAPRIYKSEVAAPYSPTSTADDMQLRY